MRSFGISKGRWVLVAVAAVVLAVCVVASILTQGAMANLPFLNGQGGGAAEASLVDQKPWQTAAALAPLAVSSEERGFAREAERLADHEVDQAFAMALRQAEMEVHVLTGPALEMQQKVGALAEQVKEDQAEVDRLTAQVSAAKTSGAEAAQSTGDDLDIAKARLQLETDELNDVNDDLARVSGDKRSEIQQQLTAREAAMQKYDSQANGGEVAVVSAKQYGTLKGQIDAWFDQRSRTALLRQAKAGTDAEIASLSAQHAALDERSNAATARIGQDSLTPGASAATAAHGARRIETGKLARMAKVHGLAQIHSILEGRLDTDKQLTEVYVKWIAQLQLEHRIVTHLILQSLAVIAAIVLVGTIAWWCAQMLLDRKAARTVNGGMDLRSVHTLRTVASLGIQLLTLILVLVVVFGLPNQVPTILGLGAAGLTVVFQSFILAFCGWFVLMGKNGIRVGDWVEINGVGGEVVEVGLFRTTLLEAGNWTDSGHPTGRRVMMMNSFAVTGQFFNFSTVGQWMWNEIRVNVPAGEGTFKTIEEIHKAVLEQTAADSKLAEQEWKGSARRRDLGQFSAAPSVDLRPAATGIDILVRYVTRAGDRFEMRNKLYQTVIELMRAAETAKEDAAVKL
ncbi:MAG: mechanosensitive ion channel [Acidobacteriota bacterium]|nr:mechanosensitive ion channel [Acidobacteriota bacterium]